MVWCALPVMALRAVLARQSQTTRYFISTVAGGAPPPTPMPAVNVSVNGPSGVAVAGDLCFAGDNCVFSRAGYSGVLRSTLEPR